MIKPPIRGNCRSCKTEYSKQIYVVDIEHEFAGYVPQACPKCNYHPHIEDVVKRIIERDAEFTVRATHDRSSRVSVNSDKLTELIINELLRYWPQ